MLRPRCTFLIVLSIFAAIGVAADQPPAPAKQPAKQPSQKPVVVFIDPATGQIRQPDASEIGGLVPATGTVAPKAPEAAPLQGPGGAVGVRLSEDSLAYMVVTIAPDGKLAMDCVTGDKAATARITATTPAPKSKETGPQDTHDVKVPR